MAKKIHREEGFTLIELMIVILIIGILVAIAVPVFMAARGNAEKKACLANQRNFMSAADIYAADLEVYPIVVDDAWPADYYDGVIVDGGPECPGGGIITVTYGTAENNIRPSTNCAGAGGEATEHGAP